MQSDETGDLGPGWELTRTRTSTHVLEVRQDDQQSKEDVLDMIREICELVAEDDLQERFEEHVKRFERWHDLNPDRNSSP